jgi:predicted phage terminase large subunit-like protein
MSEELARSVAYKSLAAYCLAMWNGFLVPPHIVTLIQHLEAVERGDIKRLIISMPPRHGKSMTLAQYFPAWCLGRKPDRQIVYTSYEQTQASKYGRLVRNQLLEPAYRKIFPDCVLSEDSSAKDIFSTKKVNGTYKAVGRGGAITGSGADIFIGDDLLKDNLEASSATIRMNQIDWYKSVASTRLQKEAAVILCGTRWHEDDLIGWVEKNNADENWVVLNFPAVNKDGEALWGEMFSSETLEKIKKRLGPYFWNALYMGRPSALEGNILKRNGWRFWNGERPQVDYIIQSWDMNFKETAKGSFVVGQIWGYRTPNLFLLDQYRGRVSFRDALLAFVNLCNRWPQSRAKVIEGKANGPAVISMFKEKVSGVVEFNPDQYGSKEARAQVVGHYQDAGNIYLPNPKQIGFEWVAEFIDRCASFPNIADKDEIDSMSQAVLYITKGQDGILRLDKLLTGL